MDPTFQLSDAYFIKSVDGTYLFINEAGAHMVGRKPAEIVGKNDFQLFDDSSARQTIDWDRKVMQLKSPLTYYDTSTASEVTRVYHSTKTPLLDAEGNVTAIVGISRDITKAAEKKAKEELRVDPASLDLSHEIKTPLTVLQTVLELESRDLELGIQRAPEFRRKLLGNARFAADRLSRLIELLKT